MKTVIESMQSLGMDNFRVAYTRFLAFYSDNPSGLYDGETSAKWQSKVNFASHPSTETEWPPKLLTRFSSWRIELHNDMQESLQVWATFLRFNPLNLAKIVCFAKWVKGAKCVSDFLNEKVLMILTCIIDTDKGSIKSTSKLEALGRTILSGAIGWILTKFAYFTSISGPRVAPKENSLKKNLQKANFSNLVSYLLYTY